MIRVLHIVGSMDRNGLQSFIMNVYRNIDRDKVQFDFVEFRSEPCEYDSEIESLGGKIYRLPSKSSHFYKCINSIRKIVKDNKYQIVHRHYYSSTMVFELLAAKLGGAKTLIAHSHSTRALSRAYLHYIFRPLLSGVATRKIACSEEAGKWMYGKRRFLIFRNGISYETFRYNSIVREKIRDELQISDSFVIGNVARFEKVKNHVFMINLIERYVKRNQNAKLLLVGNGNDYNRIKDLVKERKLDKYTLFVGSKSNVSDYLQAFDAFILPSLYEGIPLTLIEAQVNGLKCIVSENVDKTVNITGNISFLGIAESDLDKWCYELDNVRDNDTRYIISEDAFIKTGYSSKSITEDLQNLYEDLAKGDNNV